MLTRFIYASNTEYLPGRSNIIFRQKVSRKVVRPNQPMERTLPRCALQRRSSARWASLAHRVAVFSIVLLSAPLSSQGAIADWDVEMNGAGPVRIGMSLAEVNEALGEQVMAPDMGRERSCFHVDSSDQPSLDFMIDEGKLTRIDVSASGDRTDKGIAVGDLVSTVKAAYGKELQTDKHYLDPNAYYLTVLSKDKQFGIRFEVSNDKVTAFYAGTVHAINLVEGCE